MSSLLRLLLVFSLVRSSESLRVQPAAIGRRSLIGAATAVATVVLHPAAAPAESKGGKYDKSFDECLSKCVYEETKITKGIAKVEVKSRSEAFVECKPKCAKTKEQLLTGKPK